jgi:hypothetical protein
VPKLSKQQQADILLADHQRWQARNDHQDPTSRAGLSSYAEDQAALHGIGLVTSRETRFSPRWKPGTLSQRDRVINNAVIHIFPDGTRIVKQHKTVIERGSRSMSKPATVSAGRIMAADLPAIGNVE